MQVSSWAAPDSQVQGSGKKLQSDKPFDPQKYVDQKAAIFFVSFRNLAKCVDDRSHKVSGLWDPDKLSECKRDLVKFKKSRLALDANTLLDTFSQTPKGKELLKDAAFIDSLHPHICGIFTWIIELKDIQSKSYNDIIAIKHFEGWYADQAKDYMKKLKHIDKLLNDYENLKNSGHMVSTPFVHFDISSSTRKKMAPILNELGKYLDFNVDSGRLFPARKGLFLADLDYHSSQFVKNVNGSIRRMDALISKFRHDQQHLVDLKINDLVKFKDSQSFKYFDSIPLVMEQVTNRFINMFQDVANSMKDMRDGKNPVGALLIQKDLASETRFTRNSHARYTDSVRDRLVKLMLNTKDKHNKDLKHHIRGQIYIL